MPMCNNVSMHSNDIYRIMRLFCLIWIFTVREFSVDTFLLNSFITKTHLYNFDPLKHHFYIVKLGFTGVYIIFLILLKT